VNAQGVYPEFMWFRWRTESPSKKFWTREQQRRYAEWMEQEMDISRAEDWTKVRNSDLLQRGGVNLLSLFDFSVYDFVKTVFPEYRSLKVWQFGRVSAKFWYSLWKLHPSLAEDVQREMRDNQRAFTDWYAEQHGMRSQEDWYKIKQEDFVEGGGNGILINYSYSLVRALIAIYSGILFLFLSFGFWCIN
jgi:hypothetical protein